MLRILDHGLAIRPFGAQSLSLRRAAVSQPRNSFSQSHTHHRSKQPLTFKKPSGKPREEVKITFKKDGYTRSKHEETLWQTIKRVCWREAELFRFHGKPYVQGVNSAVNEVMQRYDERRARGASQGKGPAERPEGIRWRVLLFSVAIATVINDWLFRCIPYGWPGEPREEFERARAKVIGFFGFTKNHENEVQKVDTDVEDGESQWTVAGDYEATPLHDTQGGQE